MKKKITSIILALAMCLSLSVPAFAMSTEENDNMDIGLNAIDMTTSHRFCQTFIVDGKEATVELIYEPSIQSRSGYKDYDAVVGTWTSKYNSVIVTMSYKFDISRSGSQWKISNPRNLTVSAFGGSISDRNLTVYRAVSTNSYPAEITGSAEAAMFVDILYSTTFLLGTTITSAGVLTVSWN